MTAAVAPARVPGKPRTRASAIAWSLVGLYVLLVILGLRFESQAMALAFIDVWIFFAMLWFVVIGALIVGRHQTNPLAGCSS